MLEEKQVGDCGHKWKQATNQEPAEKPGPYRKGKRSPLPPSDLLAKFSLYLEGTRLLKPEEAALPC